MTGMGSRGDGYGVYVCVGGMILELSIESDFSLLCALHLFSAFIKSHDYPKSDI